ncbi:ArgE/DapE family deacylase [Streptomyces sp. NPDC002763]|uniref:ArgE/DapE family deacylase n=1 Tax=unclassified Streptomyces TaxID=2593676 RepID=UPI00331C8115
MAANVEIGVVTYVQGMSWREITIHGRATHAGTTPTHLRADAGLTATQIIVRLRALVDSGDYGDLRATVGHWIVHPDLTDIISARAEPTVDLRNPDDDRMARADEALTAFRNELEGSQPGLSLTTGREARTAFVPFDEDRRALPHRHDLRTRRVRRHQPRPASTPPSYAWQTSTNPSRPEHRHFPSAVLRKAPMLPETPVTPGYLDSDPARLLARLISIDSVNPDLVPGGAGESVIADFCGAWLAARGFEIHRLEKRPGRPSLVAIARGTGGGQSLMLNGHLDTVSLTDYDGDPLDPQIRDGRMYGRGTFDMKAGIAAMMVAAARTTAHGPLRGDVVLACVADEEYSSSGTEEVLEAFTADAAIVTEPSHLDVTLAHKGFAWFDVDIEGRAAHGSRPDLGVDAIAKTGHLLLALENLGARLAQGPAHPLLGTGTVHASVIHGGEEPSTYPAHCRTTLERRTVPGEDADSVERELAAMLDHLTATVPDFRYRLTRGLHREPFEADPDAAIVRTLTRHAEQALGHPPVVRAEPYWTDCALLDRAGIPCLLFGVDGEGAHAATEYVDLASLDRLTDILTATIADFCS